MANLSSVVRNYNSKLQLFQLTFLTVTEHCSSTSSSSFKIPKIASKSSPHRKRSSTPSAILSELVHGQSHVTGLFNIADRALKVPIRSNFPKFMFVDFSTVYVAVTYQAKPFFNPSTRSLFFFHGISRILRPALIGHVPTAQ